MMAIVLRNHNDDLGKFSLSSDYLSHLTKLLHHLSRSIEFILRGRKTEKCQGLITNDFAMQKPESSIVIKLRLLKCFFLPLIFGKHMAQ